MLHGEYMLLHYKDFIAEVQYISRVSCFYGEITYNRGIIVFLAEHAKDLAGAFKSAVDQYILYENHFKEIAVAIPEETLI